VRTNYRKSPPEEVYLFRLIGPIENGRRVFLDYMRDISRLRDHPRFYGARTSTPPGRPRTRRPISPGGSGLAFLGRESLKAQAMREL
jgi:hypothetical protein